MSDDSALSWSSLLPPLCPRIMEAVGENASELAVVYTYAAHFQANGNERFSECNGEDGLYFLYSSLDGALSMKDAIAVLKNARFRGIICNDDEVKSMLRAAESIAACPAGEGKTLMETYKVAFPDKEYTAPKAIAALARLPILCVKHRVKRAKREFKEYHVYERFVNGDEAVHRAMAIVYRRSSEAILESGETNSTDLTQQDIQAALDMCGCHVHLKNVFKFCIQRAAGYSNKRMHDEFGIGQSSEASKNTGKLLWDIKQMRDKFDHDLFLNEDAFFHSCGTTREEFELFCLEHDDDDDYMVDDDNVSIDVVQNESESESESDSEDDEMDPENLKVVNERIQQALEDADKPLDQRDIDLLLNLIVEDESENEDENGVDKFRILAMKAKTNAEYIHFVKQGRAKLIRRARYRKKMEVAEAIALKRPKAYNALLNKDFKGVGKFLEQVCRESQIGADRWRATGHITLEQGPDVGKLGQRLTFKTMKKRIEEEYKKEISLSSVKRLCVARNARHKSSSWYLGWAGIVSRKIRKGRPQLFNPDAHWSAAFYLGLEHLYFATDVDKSVVNRDDQAGKRLHSTYTNMAQKSMMIQDCPTQTITSDYIFAEIKGVIQPSNYLSTGFRNPGAKTRLLSVVKANEVHPKTPMQHLNDLQEIVTKHPKMRGCFYDSKGERKKIELIMVDSGPDENPQSGSVRVSHVKRHLESETYLHVVTARAAGSSRLNPVERFNGNMGNAINNVFIPATLLGSHGDPDKPNYNSELFVKNMFAAIQLFCHYVTDSVGYDGVPISTAVPPVCPKEKQIYGQYLTKYASACWNKSGTRSAMEKVIRECKDEPGGAEMSAKLVEEFETLNTVYNNHLVARYEDKDMPKYVFMLRCCWKADCPHPACKAAKGIAPHGWDWQTRKWAPDSNDSAPIHFFPFPRVDSNRPATRKETIEGQRVRVHGLTGAQERHNSRKGTCTRFDNETSICTLTLHADERFPAATTGFKVKFDNVTSTEGCSGMIHGKDLLAEDVSTKHPKLLIELPSAIIARELIERNKQEPEQRISMDEWIESLSEDTCLSEEEVLIWIGHLEYSAENRKLGAEQSALKRKENTKQKMMIEKENTVNKYHRCKPTCTCGINPCPYLTARLCDQCKAVIFRRECMQTECKDRRKRDRDSKGGSARRVRTRTSSPEENEEEMDLPRYDGPLVFRS